MATGVSKVQPITTGIPLGRAPNPIPERRQYAPDGTCLPPVLSKWAIGSVRVVSKYPKLKPGVLNGVPVRGVKVKVGMGMLKYGAIVKLQVVHDSGAVDTVTYNPGCGTWSYVYGNGQLSERYCSAQVFSKWLSNRLGLDLSNRVMFILQNTLEVE